MKTWWLSFSKEGRNAGVVITEAADLGAAIRRAWELKINPGGSVMGVELPEEAPKDRAWPRDVLISPEQLRAAGYLSTREEKEGVKEREA